MDNLPDNKFSQILADLEKSSDDQINIVNIRLKKPVEIEIRDKLELSVQGENGKKTHCEKSSVMTEENKMKSRVSIDNQGNKLTISSQAEISVNLYKVHSVWETKIK